MTGPESSGVQTQYRYLHKYLRDRFADTVVLTFAEIEDLLGSSLPDAARLQAGWWTHVEANGTLSPQCQVWTQAKRIATPNLSSRTVRFERMPA